MRILRQFDEFLEEGVVQKRTPDRVRSASLRAEAAGRKVFWETVQAAVGISDVNANYFIEAAYDILIELIRAKLTGDGFHAAGLGAHEAEVAYLRTLGIPEPDVRVMDDLRTFRNGILYYGKRFDAEYGQKVLAFLSRFYPTLVALLGSARR